MRAPGPWTHSEGQGGQHTLLYESRAVGTIFDVVDAEDIVLAGNFFGQLTMVCGEARRHCCIECRQMPPCDTAGKDCGHMAVRGLREVLDQIDEARTLRRDEVTR